MAIRVPLLLEKSMAVIHRLDPAATKAATPYPGATSGYNSAYREPIVYDQGAPPNRTEARVELAPIRVPCQVEDPRSQRLYQQYAGNTPDSIYNLVFSKIDLLPRGLWIPATGKPGFSVNDRVSAIESYSVPGQVTVPFAAPGLYINEIQPGSFGFGPDGTDLFIAFLMDREKAEE